ncbi:MAG: efflux RND transporter periplasmic adaptor subunit [bacterium JZ-2024 1]
MDLGFLRRRLSGCLLFIAILGQGGCQAGGTPGRKEDPREEIYEVKRGTIAQSVVASGRLRPNSSVDVYAKASGIVEKLYADAGDVVVAGDILAELDRAQLKARLDRAEAALSAAQARLALVKRGPGPLQIAQAEEAVSRAQISYEDALKALERVRTLHEKGYASDEELQRAETQAMLAKTALEAGKKQLAILTSLPLPEEIAEAEANLKQAQAARDDAAEDFRNGRIVSPVSGLILKRNVEVGSTVVSITASLGPASPLFVIGDLREILFEGEIDEGDVGLVRPGQTLEVTVDAYPNEKFSGTLTTIAPQGEERGGAILFRVKGTLANPEQRLRPGMSATVHIITDRHENTLIVPGDAILYEKDKAYVFKPSSKRGRRKPEKIEVKVGFEEPDNVEIVEGIKEGDKILAKAPRKRETFFQQVEGE